MNKLARAQRAIKLARAQVAQDIKMIKSAEAYVRKVAQGINDLMDSDNVTQEDSPYKLLQIHAADDGMIFYSEDSSWRDFFKNKDTKLFTESDVNKWKESIDACLDGEAQMSQPDSNLEIDLQNLRNVLDALVGFRYASKGDADSTTFWIELPRNNPDWAL